MSYLQCFSICHPFYLPGPVLCVCVVSLVLSSSHVCPAPYIYPFLFLFFILLCPPVVCHVSIFLSWSDLRRSLDVSVCFSFCFILTVPHFVFLMFSFASTVSSVRFGSAVSPSCVHPSLVSSCAYTVRLSFLPV